MAGNHNLYFAAGAEHDEWLARVQEDILLPDLPIIDAHHHLWMREPPPYLFREFLADVDTGHNVVATVFAECHSMYRASGPEPLRPVGETEFVAGMGAMADSGLFGSARICAATTGYMDAMLGDAVEPVLQAHLEAGNGRFRGVRISAPFYGDLHSPVDDAEYLMRPQVHDAIAVLQRLSLSLDAWVYHTQISQVLAVARAFPELIIILNHYGAPILGGDFKSRQQEVFTQWQQDIATLAACPNVYMKLGAMILRRGDREHPDLPPTSEDIARAWQPWTTAAIDAFGPARCLFESNFPVHKRYCSYPVLWNAFKRMSVGYSASELADLFAGAAQRAYRITL